MFCFLQSSCRNSAFASAPIIFPMTFPVSFPFFSSSTLAREKSKLSWFCRRSVKNVNPPETSAKVSFLFFSPAIHSSAPLFKKRRSVKTVSNAEVLIPFSKLTRCVREPSKSMSPRIADSVILATCGLMLFMSAISSMHSMPISVESISLINILILLPLKSAGKMFKSIFNCRESLAIAFLSSL